MAVAAHSQSGGAVIAGAEYGQYIRTPVAGGRGVNFEGGALQEAMVEITSAQVLAMRATPKTLLAAPGAGYAWLYLRGLWILDWNTVGYTETADNAEVKYTDGSGVAASATIETTGFIDQVADKIIGSIPVLNVIVVANAALVLHNTGDGEWAAGNSPMRFFIQALKIATRL